MKKSDNISLKDDRDLVERLKKGQEWAFRQLVDKYQKKIYGIAYGITLDREESLEIVQDVFLNVYRNIETFREEAKLSSWIHKIAVNHTLNWRRKWKRRFRWNHRAIDNPDNFDIQTKLSTGKTPEDDVKESELNSRLKICIEKLPEKVRSVFVLKIIEGLSYEEIAEIMNIKRGTVSSRLHTARKQLKTCMSGYV